MSSNILLLADTSHHTNAVEDHVRAIYTNSSRNWYVENPLTNKVLHKLDLSLFDAIGIHYSLKAYDDYYLPRRLYQAITNYRGVKFLFLQDECSQAHKIGKVIDDLDIDLLFTIVKPSLHYQAYPDLIDKPVKLVTVLTGYVPEYLLDQPAVPIDERKTDIFYRARKMPYWLGKKGYEKAYIGMRTKEMASGTGLNVDISLSELDRVYGDEWLARLRGSKTVLGSESGASIWDFKGDVKMQVQRALRKAPGASFDEIEEQILSPYENNVMYNAISPRIFEAAATRTPMILFPGEYNNIIEPDKHYIRLETDFSNFNEVVDKIRDVRLLQALADRVYDDLIVSRNYSNDKLSILVENELSAQLLEKDFPGEVEAQGIKLAEVKNNYKWLNYCYCIKSEIDFIIKNLTNNFDNIRYSEGRHITSIFHYARRYVTYLLARWSRRKT